jgi:poly-gamma-glutamate synthesis protein (capsule biosynthesis protein)
LPLSFYSNFYTKTINNISFGFLGFDFITYPNLDKAEVIRKIRQYDPQVDWLIVSIHWGNEYLPKPEQWRIDLAHQMVDAGADIIHGQHPHVYQPLEIYKDKYIFYSLGNFIFDQSWSYATSHSQIVRLTLTKNQILKEELFPIEIKFNSQPWLQ